MSFFKARSSYFYGAKIIEMNGFESFEKQLNEKLQSNVSRSLNQKVEADGPMVGVMSIYSKVSFWIISKDIPSDESLRYSLLG